MQFLLKIWKYICTYVCVSQMSPPSPTCPLPTPHCMTDYVGISAFLVHLYTPLFCPPTPPPPQASVDERSGEVRQLQDTVKQLQEKQRNKVDTVSPSSSAVALSSGQQRKTLLSLRRPKTAVTELVSCSPFCTKSLIVIHLMLHVARVFSAEVTNQRF